MTLKFSNNKVVEITSCWIFGAYCGQQFQLILVANHPKWVEIISEGAILISIFAILFWKFQCWGLWHFCQKPVALLMGQTVCHKSKNVDIKLTHLVWQLSSELSLRLYHNIFGWLKFRNLEVQYDLETCQKPWLNCILNLL